MAKSYFLDPRGVDIGKEPIILPARADPHILWLKSLSFNDPSGVTPLRALVYSICIRSMQPIHLILHGFLCIGINRGVWSQTIT